MRWRALVFPLIILVAGLALAAAAIIAANHGVDFNLRRPWG